MTGSAAGGRRESVYLGLAHVGPLAVMTVGIALAASFGGPLAFVVTAFVMSSIAVLAARWLAKGRSRPASARTAGLYLGLMAVALFGAFMIPTALAAVYGGFDAFVLTGAALVLIGYLVVRRSERRARRGRVTR